jgi:hypothetical protein
VKVTSAWTAVTARRKNRYLTVPWVCVIPGLRSANNIAALVNEKQTPLIAAFFYLTIMPLSQKNAAEKQVNEVLLIFSKKFDFTKSKGKKNANLISPEIIISP